MKKKHSESRKNPTVTECICQFLRSNTHEDLASLCSENMEIQVNVSADGGERVEGRRNTYSDGAQQWYPIRIPKDSGGSPHFRDYEMGFSLEDHAEAIGMTGWDWKNCQSLWVGFDFDAITGHAAGIGISDEELNSVMDVAKAIPWVTLRKSTSGNGLHLYVFFADPPKTQNHTEHAALARAVLSQMSMLANFDFCAAVDACGGNMWVWHRKMLDSSGATIGLQLLKKGEPLSAIPIDWQSHLEVIRKKRSKVQPTGMEDAQVDGFEKIAHARASVKLDDRHRELIDWLVEHSHYATWDQDHRLLATHTSSLKAAHTALAMKGIFETVAVGKEAGDYNCFCFPQFNGAWSVYRYTPGLKEAPSWCESDRGWTYCYLNRAGDMKTAAASNGGIKTAKGAYIFEGVVKARRALQVLGIDFCIPDCLEGRDISLQFKKTELIARAPLAASDDGREMRRLGWVKEKAEWVRVFEEVVPEHAEPRDTIAGSFSQSNLDDRVRHLVTPNLGDAGWVVRDDKGRWLGEPKGNVRSVLRSWGVRDDICDELLGYLIVHVWDLVNLPFQDEFPGDRRWNRDAARLAFLPTSDDREMTHPHWDMIFDHCGSGLDQAVSENEWCKRHSILTGGDYLRLWSAILIQRPTHPLPYLFLFSEQRGECRVEIQNAGKSSLHQALGLLMKRGKGYVEADTALIDPRGFNGQLAGAILCFVEETDVSTSNAAYARIKKWVTGDNLEIHPKGLDPYMMPNTTHWIQCANSREACPVFVGDTRIVMIQVPPLPAKEIPWHEQMRPAIEREAADFLRTMLDTELPPANGRLWLPVLETDAKRDASSSTPGSRTISHSPRRIDQDELVNKVKQFLAEPQYVKWGQSNILTGTRDYWRGTFGALAQVLGYGDIKPNQLSRTFAQARDRLREMGVEIVFPDERSNRTADERTVTVAAYWMIGPEASDEEILSEIEFQANLEG